jgi:hypothetical protein
VGLHGHRLPQQHSLTPAKFGAAAEPVGNDLEGSPAGWAVGKNVSLVRRGISSLTVCSEEELWLILGLLRWCCVMVMVRFWF